MIVAESPKQSPKREVVRSVPPRIIVERPILGYWDIRGIA
jgi:hypothetical protein